MHQLHIGHVAQCYEWEHHEELEQKRGMDRAAYLLQRMESDIRSYRWTQKEISRLEKQQYRMDSIGSPGSSLTARYGIESVMPRSTAVDDTDIEEYERICKDLDKLRERIERVDRAAAVITVPREKEVLECMLEGLRVNDIAQELGITRQWVSEVRDRVIREMAFGVV